MKMPSHILSSFRRLYSKLRYFPLFALIDTAALALFSTVLYYCGNEIKIIFERMSAVADAANANFEAAMESMRGVSELVAQKDQIMAYYYDAMWYVALIFAALFALWVVSQSINWYIVEKKAFGNEKIKFGKYFFRFFALSIPWFALFTIAVFAFAKLWYSIVMLPEGLLSPAVPKGLFLIMAFFVSYLAFNSYAIAAKARLKKAFIRTTKVCIAGWKQLIPAYIVFWVIFVIEYKMLSWFFASTETLSLEALILLPFLIYMLILATLAWTRVYTIELLER